MQPDITYKWNHVHPPKQPSVFEVRNHGELIYSGPFDGGIAAGKALIKQYEQLQYKEQQTNKNQTMSGGHFEYKQYHVQELAEEIDRLIAKVHKTREDIKDSPEDPSDPNYNWERYYLFTDETLEKFAEARDTLMRASKMVQRVDWLVSGDDGEESFHARWAEEVPYS